MTVSICIPAYNAVDFIAGALKSIFRQTYTDWTLIVVEDGSNDGTSAIVDKFANQVPNHRVLYDRHETNRGVSATRNRLLELSRGDWVTFLDADDTWSPSHLEDLQQTLKSGHAIAISGINIFYESTSKTVSYAPCPEQIQHPYRALYEQSFIQTSSCVALSRETIDRVGQFDQSLRIGEDRDYWFRALENGGSLGFTGSYTCYYRKHASSAMAQTIKVAEDELKFYRKHINARNIPDSTRRKGLSNALSNHARLTKNLNRQLARRELIEAWKLCPLNLKKLLRWLLT